MNLQIYLLGPPQIIRDGNPVDLPGHRPLALLAYLLISRKPLRREQLIDLFFDGPDDPQAALRWTLSKLRKAIGSEYILADRQEVFFNFESSYWLDVFDFEGGKTELFKGDFLEGLHLRDALQFEDWLLFERQRLREKYQASLEEQLADLKREGAYAGVIITAQELLKLDGLREDWHGEIMHAYARLGKRTTALDLYEKLRLALRKEWDTDPAPETTALAEAIRSRQFEPELPPHSMAGAAHQVVPAGELSDLVSDTSDRSEPRRIAFSPAAMRLATIMLAVVLLLFLSGILAVSDLSMTTIGRSSSLIEANANLSVTATPGLSGTTVKILGVFRDKYVHLFQKSVLPLEQNTGIDVVFVNADEDYELDLEKRLESGNLPDIIVIPQPGWLARLSEQGKIVDLSTFLEREYLYRQYPETYFDLVTDKGRILGIWHTIDIKSLVWYPKQAFDAKGYQAPKTWDELIALSDQIVADGGTPWCIGLESGDFTGWVGTDWVEDILLRTAPPYVYDAWVRHDLHFDSPEIRRVFDLLGQIWLNDAYVYHGRTGITVENVFDSPDRLFENPPGCYLHKQASFAPHFFPPGLVQDQDYDFFYLPPIDSKYGRPVLGSGNLFAMVVDRPEVREVIRYLTTVEANKPFIEAGGYLSPHKDTPLQWFPTPSELRLAEIIVGADVYRFDGSDMMPQEVGLRSFNRGIVDWVSGMDLDSVLRKIDNSWPGK